MTTTRAGTTGDLQDLSMLEALHALQRLTAMEVAVAGVRSMQARDDALKQELRENRRKAQQRERLIAGAITDAGGTATPLSPVMGKALAFLKAQLDGTTTFASALLGDLAMETTLLERARFTRRLAERLGDTRVVQLCTGLEAAHTETVSWLRARLDELADTGRSRLRPLPTQLAVGALRKAATLPVTAVGDVLRGGSRGGPAVDPHPADPTTTGAADLRSAPTGS